MSYQIVVGIDGSKSSARALRWAVDEAHLRNGTVAALLAWELPLIGFPGAFDRADLEQRARDVLAEQVEAVGSVDGVAITPVVAEGDASASLLAACEQLDADLLVLGSRGGGGFKDLLLGSVGQQCTIHAPCPVLIVKDTRPTAG